jgi:antitoxin component YwqK of YwqJK toxin-antitoxin module
MVICHVEEKLISWIAFETHLPLPLISKPDTSMFCTLNRIGKLLLFFCIPLWVHAQSDTLFIDSTGAIQPPDKAPFYRVVEDANGITTVMDYHRNHKLWCKGQYSTPEAVIRDGLFTYYNTEGQKILEAAYRKGVKTGVWVEYHTGSEKMLTRKTYASDGQSYYLHEFNPYTGLLAGEGEIDRFQRRHGIWLEYHHGSDRVKYRWLFNHGRREGVQQEFHQNGQLKRTETKAGWRTVKCLQFDSNGKKTRYVPEIEYPKPPEALKTYLSKRIPCFQTALRAADIPYQIKVSADGQLSEVDFPGFSDPECKAAMVQKVYAMRRWKAGKREGKPVEMWYKGNIHYRKPIE